MKLEDIYTAIAVDFVINENDLGHESIKTEKLWIKYITLYSQEKLRLEQRQSGRATLCSVKREYYSGQAAPEVYYKNPPKGPHVKTDAGLERAIARDEDVIAYDETTIVQRIKVDLLKATVDECKQRSYSLKAAVDHMRFLNGG